MLSNLQNQHTCENVAPVPGGVPQHDSYGCVTGYIVNHGGHQSGSSGMSSITGAQDQSFGSWSTGASQGFNFGASSSSGVSGGSMEGGAMESGSMGGDSWATSAHHFAIHTGAYYQDNSGNSHPIILDRENRGFWRGANGTSHKLTEETQSGHVYYYNQAGQRTDLNVNNEGQLTMINGQGQTQMIKLNNEGRAYYTNNGGNAFLNQGTTSIGSVSGIGGGAIGGQTVVTSSDSQAYEGKLYYIGETGEIHQLFIDNQGGYYIGENNTIHAISQQGRAYYVGQGGEKHILLINTHGDVGVRQGSRVELLHENQEGQAFFQNSMGENTMLVGGTSGFNEMEGRSQFVNQGMTRSTGFSTGSTGMSSGLTGGHIYASNDTFRSSQSFSVNEQMMDVGRMYYVTEQGETYHMFITKTGTYYKNSLGQEERCTTTGHAYYVDSQHQRMNLELTTAGVGVNLSGHTYRVEQNAEGYGFIMHGTQGLFLGSTGMSSFQQVGFDQVIESQMHQSGGFSGSSFHGHGSGATGHIFVIAEGQTHNVEINQGIAYYLTSTGQRQLVNSNMTAYFINSMGQRQNLLINDQ